MKSRGSQCNETLLVRAAVRPGKKLGLQSAANVILCDTVFSLVSENLISGGVKNVYFSTITCIIAHAANAAILL